MSHFDNGRKPSPLVNSSGNIGFKDSIPLLDSDFMDSGIPQSGRGLGFK
jgi:hypothetical protein